MSLLHWLRSLLHYNTPDRSKPAASTRTFSHDSPASGEPRLPDNPPALTPREKDIVRLILMGCSNKEVAAELGIAVSTVKWNMTNILSKFEVKTSKQLIPLLSNRSLNESRDWTIIDEA